MAGFRSEAQREKFKQLLKEGKISQEIFDSMDGNTDRKHILPKLPPTPVRIKKVKHVKVIK